jgi:hypothetical protein
MRVQGAMGIGGLIGFILVLKNRLDFERRFSQMEEQPKQLRDETHKRMEALELYPGHD